jgi:hypothetical protein
MSPLRGPLADAPGIDLLPDLSLARTAADLVTALRRYRIWAGDPSFREMARRADHVIAPSTMCKALHADTMPRLGTVRAIITGCGGSEEDMRQFVSAWRHIRLATSGAQSGTRPVPEPRHPGEHLPG